VISDAHEGLKAAATKVLGASAQRCRVHFMRNALAQLGKHPQRLRRILAYEGLIAADNEGKLDASVMFDVEAAHPILTQVAQQLSLAEVERYLNAPRPRAALLYKEGFIRPSIRLDNRRVTRLGFALLELDRFLASLFEGSIEVGRQGPDIADIPGAAKRANCGIGEVVRLVLERKLAWVGRRNDVRGFMSVLVKVDEVSRRVRGPDIDGLAEYKVTQRLKVQWQAVRKLIEHGVLNTQRVVNPVNRCATDIVPISNLVAFEETYVSLFGLAREKCMHPQTLKKRLTEKGISPDLPSETFFTSFYRRERITPFNCISDDL